MRDTTERPEAVASGAVKLVGTDHEAIIDNVSSLIENGKAYKTMAQAINPYGDGLAAERIVSILAGEKPFPIKT